MKVLFDSNVLLDVILQRKEFFADSHAAMLRIANGKIKAYVSASAITDIYYILKKDFHNSSKALSAVKGILSILKVAKVDTKAIENAVRLDWKDFEDCVQFCAGKRCGVKCIITRDTKGFFESDIPVFSPTEFLAKIK